MKKFLRIVAAVTAIFAFASCSWAASYVPMLTVSSFIPSDAKVGEYYIASFVAIGGRSPYSWTLGGSLPTGLSLSGGASASISGVIAKPGTYTFWVTVRDSSGQVAMSSLGYLVVADPNSPPSVRKDSLKNCQPETEYLDEVSAINGQPPYTWQMTNGKLPSGINFASSGDKAVFYGTTTQEGSYSFGLKVTDANGRTGEKQMSLKVFYPPLTISGWIPGEGKVGELYNGSTGLRFSAEDGFEPYTWKISEGFLPPGMYLTNEGNGVNGCRILGAPLSGDTYNFTLSVTDGKGRTAEKDLTCKVNGGVINYGSISIGGDLKEVFKFSWGYPKYGSYYDFLTAEGGRSPYKWSIISGSLPKGLTSEDQNVCLVVKGRTPDDGVYEDNEFVMKLVDADGRTAFRKLSIRVPDGAAVGSKGIKLPAAPPVISGKVSEALEGKSYSAIFSASKGKAPYTWSADATGLPEGLSLSCSDSKTNTGSGLTGKYAHIKGTPKSGGNFCALTMKVTDANGNTDAKLFVFKIVQKPSISSGNLEDGVTNAAYNGVIGASGGKTPYKWALSKGKLPDGLSLTSSGDNAVISGIPSKSGKFSFTLKVTDKSKISVSRTLTINITKTKLDGSLPSASTVKADYNGEISASGGTSPYTWSISSGNLPDGLKLKQSGDKAVISGKTTKAGTFKFTVKASDKNNVAGTKAYTVKVTKTSVSGNIPAASARKAAYNGVPKVSGGVSPYKWSVSSGKLPDGLKIDASTGKITGKPTKAGTSNFTLKAADKNGAAGTKAYTVKITETTISGSIPASSPKKAAYNGVPKVSGGTSPYKWSISSGKLPDGLKIDASTGKITGKPTKAGTFNFTVKASDKNSAAGTKTYTVKVTQTEISGNIPSTSTKLSTYTGTLNVTGGTKPYKWSISSGSLPAGLKINASTGKITGKPSKAGTFKFTVKAADKNGDTGTKAFTVKVTEPKVTGSIPAQSTRLSTCNAALTAANGASPYTWSISSGKLPDGLKLNAKTGKITGKFTKTGTFKFTVKAADKNGASGTKAFTMKVTQTKIEAALSNIAVKGYAYSGTLTASGGTASYNWSISAGKLPAGLKLTSSGAKAVISGSPSKTGTYTFTVKAKDKNGAADTLSFTFIVVNPPSNSSSAENTNDKSSANEPETQDKTDNPKQDSYVPNNDELPQGNAFGTVSPSVSLHVVSDDIVESYDDRDSDLVKVHADKSLRFTVSSWGAEISSAVVYIDDKPLNGITVSDEGLFILPAEIVSGDFKVGVKAHSEAGELESSELYIITE